MDTVKVTKKEGIPVIALKGKIIQEDSSELEAALEKAFLMGAHSIIVDLTGVKHICSSALGVLVSAKRRLKDGGDLRICVRDGEVKKLLNITMMDRIFELYDHADLAVESFRT